FPRLTDEPMQLFMGERDSLQSMNWKPTDQPFRSAGLLPKPLSEGVFLPVANRTAFSAPNFQDTISSNVDSTLLDTDSSYWREEGSEAHHYRQLYQVMGINKMGWINCDRFWDDPTPKRSIEIEIENQDLEYVDLFLVFEDINSLMSGFSFDGQPARFSGLPSGRQVTLIVFSVMEDTPYLYKKSFQTQDFAKTEIELVPTTLEQLANQMEEL
ncbi:MAG TPA: hypothetical protein DCP28_29920, partial [Cytophagales bacterium]|nr:hypothetical protein [Cytophagales bacterium]